MPKGPVKDYNTSIISINLSPQHDVWDKTDYLKLWSWLTIHSQSDQATQYSHKWSRLVVIYLLEADIEQTSETTTERQ